MWEFKNNIDVSCSVIKSTVTVLKTGPNTYSLSPTNAWILEWRLYNSFRPYMQ